MMDADAIRALVSAAVSEAMVAARTTAGGGGVHKHYQRLEKLKEDDWKEWHYQFSVDPFVQPEEWAPSGDRRAERVGRDHDREPRARARPRGG